MDVINFFQNPQTIAQKQYEALRMFFIDGTSAYETADKFGYSYRGFTSLVAYFKSKLSSDPLGLFIFTENKPGRKISLSYQLGG